MNELIVTVGLPRSGKSSWAKKQGLPIVNRDSIRLALHGQAYIQKCESFVSVLEENMVESLFLAGHQKVIVDATNTTEESRDRWISYRWKTSFECFRVSPDICKLRAEDTMKVELIPVIDRMSESLTFPKIK